MVILKLRIATYCTHVRELNKTGISNIHGNFIQASTLSFTVER